MIQTGFNARKTISFIKDNIGIMILVPAFFGGIWQLIELMNISIAYVRFFSISQLVPDGILILMFLLLAFSIGMFHLFLDCIFPAKTNKVDNTTPITDAEIEQKRKKDLKKWLSTFIVTYILGAVYFTYFYKLIINDGIYTDGLVALLVCLLCTLSLSNCYNLASLNKKEDFKFFNVLLMFFYILILYHFCNRIHNTFLFTNSLDNIENVKCILKEKYPNSKNEILYFNDKYIFINVTDTLNRDKVSKGEIIKKIHIMELEKLFND